MRFAAERGARLTDQLLSFSRRQRLEPKVIDLNQTVSGMRDLLQSTMGGSIRIETRLTTELWPALVDLTQLELAVLNLSINARDAMEMGGTLSVSTGNVSLGLPFYPEEPPAGDYVAVSVIDTGAGMTSDVRSKAFEPFFTTKDVGKGSGLGLGQVLGFAKQSGGGVRIRSMIGTGTAVDIFVPRADAQPLRPEPPGWFPGSVVKASARLILVDDDNAVRESPLRELGYTVLEAGSGGAALELLEHSTNIDLMLVDFAMPGMSGAEVARRVQTTRPALPVLFVTGYADRAALEGVSETQIIGKPFLNQELHDKVRAALAARTPAAPRRSA